MGSSTRYPHIERLIRTHYCGGRALEIGAGGAVYCNIFDDYVGTDLLTTPHADAGDIQVYCDAQSLPFRSESFDFAFTVACLYQIAEPGIACQEIWRCLKDRGVLLVFDYTVNTKVHAIRNNLRQNQNKRFSFWRGGELERLLFYSGFRRARRIENDTKWQILTKMAPEFVDWHRTWLIVKAEK